MLKELVRGTIKCCETLAQDMLYKKGLRRCSTMQNSHPLSLYPFPERNPTSFPAIPYPDLSDLLGHT